MSGTPKHPKQLYVTLKQEQDFVYDKDPITGDIMYGHGRHVDKPNPLGFAHDYTPHLKSFAKKKDTQLKWAYGSNYEDNNGVIWFGPTHRWEGRHPNSVCVSVPGQQVQPNLQPRVIINEPIEGFTISHSVNRSATSNKVWRILDPRGFELEISTDCMEDLVLQGTIIKGAIQGKCIWHTGKILCYA
jgi:hypothetical protein